jgi:uncharacterized membrane protein HdeD (DUF308 family)
LGCDRVHHPRLTFHGIGDQHSTVPRAGGAIVFGSICVIAGFVMLAYPFDSIETLAIVVGTWLTVLGATEVIAGLGMRSDVKKVKRVTDAALGATP